MHRARGTADDKRDSHPRRCSFPRGLHLRLHWQHISRLQFKAKGPNFHAELIPVHSPLLRKSCLVSHPPLTYMLKFSGFADLTSCLRTVSCSRKFRTPVHISHNKSRTHSTFCLLNVDTGPIEHTCQGAQDTLANNCTQVHTRQAHM